MEKKKGAGSFWGGVVVGVMITAVIEATSGVWFFPFAVILPGLLAGIIAGGGAGRGAKLGFLVGILAIVWMALIGYRPFVSEHPWEPAVPAKEPIFVLAVIAFYNGIFGAIVGAIGGYIGGKIGK